MATMAAAVSGGGSSSSGGGKKAAAFKDKDKPDQVRSSNMVAAKAVADLIRTSLGPKGMDKMIQAENGDVSITNDGATILKQISVNHPCARMLVELSQAQDVAAGDGTTSVVVLAGSLLAASEKLLAKGIHPTAISEAFQRAATAAEEILASMATPVDLADTELLTKIAATSLNSKMVSQSSHLLAPMAVKAIRGVTEAEATDVDLKRIKVIKKLGGTVEDSELVEGAVFNQKASGAPGAPTRMEKAKIGLIQFQLSPPKTDMENTVVIQDYAAMDRALREERAYLLELCKGIKKAGCNVLLIQKSILRDAVNEMSLHFLAKMKIMVVKDVERDDIEFICRSIGCRPVASLDHFTPEALGTAELVEEVPTADGKLIKVTGVANPGKALSLIIRGSNKLMLEEAERSIHDALSVLRCLVKKRGIICGGGAPEMEMGVRIREMGLGKSGVDGYCFRAFADAVEIVPYTLAENAGLNPIQTVTELRNRHAKGEKTAGINVRKGFVTNILEESVVQPLLVSASAIRLATETVRSILKIDDVLRAMRD